MKNAETDGGKGPPDAGNQWLAFLNLGWLIALNMLVFAGGGIWLDRRWRTEPWLMVAGVFLGICGSGYTVYRAVKKLESGESGKSRK